MSAQPSKPFSYSGAELELVQHMTNWKQYLRRQLAIYYRGRVLEVGAGIGGTTRVLAEHHRGTWTCLEPDPAQRLTLERSMGSRVRIAGATLADLAPHERFDSILYIDVLEHIGGDALELRQAASHLEKGGRLIVLAPAHMWLYTEFDRAIGHFRRYTRASLMHAVPKQLVLRQLRYLDSAGLVASAMNRWVLRKTHPTARLVALWDEVLLPVSHWLDPILGYRVGKSILGVWERRD